jgi:hypothetical protein
VARAPDAEELEVDPAGRVDRLLVAAALLLDLAARQIAAGEVHLLRRDIELGEEILPHEPVIAVHAGGGHRVVLVQVEGDDPGEAQALLSVHPDQLAVDADRRRPRGEPEHGLPARAAPRADQLGDPARDQPAELVVVAHDDGRNALEGGGRIRHAAEG